MTLPPNVPTNAPIPASARRRPLGAATGRELTSIAQPAGSGAMVHADTDEDAAIAAGSTNSLNAAPTRGSCATVNSERIATNTELTSTESDVTTPRKSCSVAFSLKRLTQSSVKCSSFHPTEIRARGEIALCSVAIARCWIDLTAPTGFPRAMATCSKDRSAMTLSITTSR